MSFTSKIKKYEIDLKDDQYVRWSKVVQSEKNFAKLMIDNSKVDYEKWIKILKGPVGYFYKKYGGLYIQEMKSWSEALGISLNEVITLNCQYELNHSRLSLNFGCTAAAVWVKGIGMVHLRNMDWELDEMGKATRIFVFKEGRRKFITFGVPGQIGVLSGFLPKAYSVTINYAPTITNPWFNGYGPLFLLRDVFENCNSFEEAVKKLKRTKLATNVFFIVCGTKKNQACVIERTKDKSSVKFIEGNYLTLGNHFKSRRFKKLNWDEELNEDSMERECVLKCMLENLKDLPTIDEIASCLDFEPTLNDDTCQQMIFIPNTGEYKVWRKV